MQLGARNGVRKGGQRSTRVYTLHAGFTGRRNAGRAPLQVVGDANATGYGDEVETAGKLGSWGRKDVDYAKEKLPGEMDKMS